MIKMGRPKLTESSLNNSYNLDIDIGGEINKEIEKVLGEELKVDDIFNLKEIDKTIDKINNIRNDYSNLQVKLKSKKNFLKNFVEKKSNRKYLEILNKTNFN